MKKEDVRKILENLDECNNYTIYYDLSKITSATDLYVKNNWEKVQNKYDYKEIWAILAPQKFLDTCCYYFLDSGVVYDDKIIRYNEILVVGEWYKISRKNIVKDGYAICTLEGKAYIYLKESKNSIVYKVLEKIMEECIEPCEIEDKVKFYMERMSESYEKTVNWILCKKIITLSQSPDMVEEAVKEYGILEWSVKYLKAEQKADNYIRRKMALCSAKIKYKTKCEIILKECEGCLKLLCDCNILKGYIHYVILTYAIIAYASAEKERMDDKLAYKYNMVIDDLMEKIKGNKIDIPNNEVYDFMMLIKKIANIYFGEVYFDYAEKPVKCNYMKNSTKAVFWLNQYLGQAGSENTVEYDKILFMLSDIYKYGADNIEADEEKSLDYLKKAAYNGSSKACKVLAEHYDKVDSEEKEKWFQLAKANGQKPKDKRNINERMKDTIGIDLQETAETIESITGIGKNIQDLFESASSIVAAQSSIAESKNATRNQKRQREIDELEHEQKKIGQGSVNKQAKAKIMKKERKAEEEIAKEEQKRRR